MVSPIIVGPSVRTKAGGEVSLAVGLGFGSCDGNGVGLTVIPKIVGPFVGPAVGDKYVSSWGLESDIVM